MDLAQKSKALNAFIEDVDNWVVARNKYVIWPETWKEHQMPSFTHENLIIAARVEMFGIGKVFKRLVLTSDKYLITEIPRAMRETVMDEVFSSETQDTLNPRSVTQPDGNMLEYEARWVPPNDYYKKLMERSLAKKIMTPQEWEVWQGVFLRQYGKFRKRPPNYVVREPFSQVPAGRG